MVSLNHQREVHKRKEKEMFKEEMMYGATIADLMELAEVTEDELFGEWEEGNEEEE